jgi:glyceraldehyde-3-phosphate dehydrogenase (NADP+)
MGLVYHDCIKSDAKNKGMLFTGLATIFNSREIIRMTTELFPRLGDLPDFARFESARGNILINGVIEKEGYDRKSVYSPCALRDEKGTLTHPLLGETPNVSQEVFARAVDAAQGAWAKGRGLWATARMEDRIQAVANFRERVLPLRERVANHLMWEIAKPWPDALAEFDRTMVYIAETVEAAKKLDRDSSSLHFASEIVAQIRRAPLGVTLCIGPFNYPLNETFTTLVPALIMGNPVVVKTPRHGQLFWELFLEPFRDNFPPGVVNIVNGLGREIIGPSVEAGKVDVLALIGSSVTANKIKQSHPRPNSFRGVLGLDAKNPAIILPDADLEVAVRETLKGSLSFNGQRCTALKIIFVHRDIGSEFTRRLVEKVDALKYGMPWEKGVFITPLPTLEKVEQLQGLIQEAVTKGAHIANPERGGKSLDHLLYPTVLSGVSLKSAVAYQEQFGPVIPVVEYDSETELENYLLDSPYGMQASVFGDDPVRVGKWIDLLSNLVCRINLNTQCQRGPDVFPFTGRKLSAEGTLSVTDALRCFSIRSMVATKQDAEGKALFRKILEKDTSRFLTTNIVM